MQVFVGETPDKGSKLVAPCQITIVQMDWLYGEVEMNRQQHKQFDG